MIVRRVFLLRGRVLLIYLKTILLSHFSPQILRFFEVFSILGIYKQVLSCYLIALVVHEEFWIPQSCDEIKVKNST